MSMVTSDCTDEFLRLHVQRTELKDSMLRVFRSVFKCNSINAVIPSSAFKCRKGRSKCNRIAEIEGSTELIRSSL